MVDANVSWLPLHTGVPVQHLQKVRHTMRSKTVQRPRSRETTILARLYTMSLPDVHAPAQTHDAPLVARLRCRRNSSFPSGLWSSRLQPGSQIISSISTRGMPRRADSLCASVDLPEQLGPTRTIVCLRSGQGTLRRYRSQIHMQQRRTQRRARILIQATHLRLIEHTSRERRE